MRKTPRLAALLGALLALGASEARALEFKPYARGAFAELRKAHAGRPLLVHFWSVTCPPCLAELPDWAKVAAEKRGVDLVFVNADHENDRARAQLRLEKAGLGTQLHYGFADDFAERLYFEVDPMWRGELPFTAMLDSDGKLVTVTGAIGDPLLRDWLAKAYK